ncbi:MAG: hypothetical protein GF404_09670 [candidate division Zixibacteria bacterium]|nr:hypothetical protein [candidate division Zixibacteria bacterium]
MLNNFDQIQDRVKSEGKKKRVLLWGADDPHWLRILTDLVANDQIEATVLGHKPLTDEAFKKAEVPADRLVFHEANEINEAIPYIQQALREDKIDIIVRGTVWIKDSLSALFNRDTGFRKKKQVISAVSCHYVKDIDRLLIVTDPVVNPVPDLTRKIAIVNNAVAFAHKLEDDNPKVALLAAVETVYPVMQHTIEAAAVAKMNDRNQIKGCLVDGPLSMDCAVIERAARAKGVTGEVGGNANILVAPNIETAYGMNKAFTRFVGAPSGCVVIGGKVPLAMASRADSYETKLNSIYLAMLS